MLKLKHLLVGLASATILMGGDYSLDQSHSKVAFKVRHMMVSNTWGSFNDFSGKFSYDEKSNQLTALEGKVNVASINTEHEKRDKHLRAADFFDVAQFPTMTLKMVKLQGDTLIADLTIKGVTKRVEFDYESGGTIKDPWGNHKAAFSLEGSINRKEFGLTWNKVLEAGGVAVGEKVKLYIDIEGNRS